MKTCTSCDQTKPFADFYPSKTRPSGYGSWCKPCYKIKYAAVNAPIQLARRRARKYGLGPNDINELMRLQNGVCAICKSDTPDKTGWHVDHCHSKNAVRGILCGWCNRMLGLARDRPETLSNAIDYLNKDPFSTISSETISAAVRQISVKRKPLSMKSRINKSRAAGGTPLKDELGNIFQTVRSAADFYGICESDVSKSLNGKLKRSTTRGGHSFSRVNDPLKGNG